MLLFTYHKKLIGKAKIFLTQTPILMSLVQWCRKTGGPWPPNIWQISWPYSNWGWTDYAHQLLLASLWSVDLIYIRYLKMQWLPIDFIPNIFHCGWNGNGAVGGKHKEVKIWPDWIESRHALMPRSQLRHNGCKVFLNSISNLNSPAIFQRFQKVPKVNKQIL